MDADCPSGSYCLNDSTKTPIPGQLNLFAQLFFRHRTCPTSCCSFYVSRRQWLLQRGFGLPRWQLLHELRVSFWWWMCSSSSVAIGNFIYLLCNVIASSKMTWHSFDLWSYIDLLLSLHFIFYVWLQPKASRGVQVLLQIMSEETGRKFFLISIQTVLRLRLSMKHHLWRLVSSFWFNVGHVV